MQANCVTRCGGAKLRVELGHLVGECVFVHGQRCARWSCRRAVLDWGVDHQCRCCNTSRPSPRVEPPLHVTHVPEAKQLTTTPQTGKGGLRRLQLDAGPRRVQPRRRRDGGRGQRGEQRLAHAQEVAAVALAAMALENVRPRRRADWPPASSAPCSLYARCRHWPLAGLSLALIGSSCVQKSA